MVVLAWASPEKVVLHKRQFIAIGLLLIFWCVWVLQLVVVATVNVGRVKL